MWSLCWWLRQRSPGTTTTTRCSQCSRMSPIFAGFYIIHSYRSPPPQAQHSGQGGQAGRPQGEVLVLIGEWDLVAKLFFCFPLCLGLRIKTTREQPDNKMELSEARKYEHLLMNWLSYNTLLERTSPQARRAPAWPSASPSMEMRQWSTLRFSSTSNIFTFRYI